MGAEESKNEGVPLEFETPIPEITEPAGEIKVSGQCGSKHVHQVDGKRSSLSETVEGGKGGAPSISTGGAE